MKYFITYGNHPFKRSKERLVKEVARLSLFDQVIAYGPDDFRPDFKEKHNAFITNNFRGGGYWIWKPYFVLETLKSMKENDILVYADAGCKVYPEHKKRMFDYFSLVEESRFGLLVFEGYKPEFKYTKSDLAEKLGVLKNHHIMSSPQLVATAFVLRKCSHSLKIVHEWLSVCSAHYHLIDDSRSLLPNHQDFVGHRHDQSVFSLLCKKLGASYLPNETYPQGSGPISANRISDRKMSFLGSLGNVINLSRWKFLFSPFSRIYKRCGAVLISMKLRLIKYKFPNRYWSKRYRSDSEALEVEHHEHIAIMKKCHLGAVEIGVLNGATTKILAKANSNIPVYGIDPLIPDSMNSQLIGSEAVIQENTKGLNNFQFIKGYSFDVIKEWDKPFDYLFIDGSHIYEDVKQDFEDWFPKLSKNGIVSFHDSTMYRGGQPYWEGASRFADELIQNTRLQFLKSVGRLTIFQKK